MTTSLFKRVAATAAVALAALGAASVAQARSDITWSIGIGSPGVYVHPAPVYAPQPVYVQPRAYYYPPAPVYVPPRVVYTQPAYGYYNGPAWRRAQWERQHGWHHNHGRRDHGRDHGRWHGRDDDRDRRRRRSLSPVTVERRRNLPAHAPIRAPSAAP